MFDLFDHCGAVSYERVVECSSFDDAGVIVGNPGIREQLESHANDSRSASFPSRPVGTVENQ